MKLLPNGQKNIKEKHFIYLKIFNNFKKRKKKAYIKKKIKSMKFLGGYKKGNTAFDVKYIYYLLYITIKKTTLEEKVLEYIKLIIIE
ncbi:hypothetical protein PFFVO_02722 [Plasmodium falciparum Vietnam Oak-Knoll (FVO)]|uniref:Uncharacterized protein n=1 Tax=Plasmodium falciparum Vietnam Oak-Knoll (FVO) TaxID=1036723 RepID=A0A024V5Y7_PLAFA|nr:hypothetical protein PFFVO_02722 [Plasmodium falciparum Vietnam Oak-Knoll (FVO)]